MHIFNVHSQYLNTINKCAFMVVINAWTDAAVPFKLLKLFWFKNCMLFLSSFLLMIYLLTWSIYYDFALGMCQKNQVKALLIARLAQYYTFSHVYECNAVNRLWGSSFINVALFCSEKPICIDRRKRQTTTKATYHYFIIAAFCNTFVVQAIHFFRSL